MVFHVNLPTINMNIKSFFILYIISFHKILIYTFLYNTKYMHINYLVFRKELPEVRMSSYLYKQRFQNVICCKICIILSQNIIFISYLLYSLHC